MNRDHQPFHSARSPPLPAWVLLEDQLWVLAVWVSFDLRMKNPSQLNDVWKEISYGYIDPGPKRMTFNDVEHVRMIACKQSGSYFPTDSSLAFQKYRLRRFSILSIMSASI